eukprot:SAG22_NODE_606_length_8615_cov_6.190348_7_plen_96_part_00
MRTTVSPTARPTRIEPGRVVQVEPARVERRRRRCSGGGAGFVGAAEVGGAAAEHAERAGSCPLRCGGGRELPAHRVPLRPEPEACVVQEPKPGTF